MDNESYLIVREFKDIPIKNILNYPLENDMDYTVQVNRLFFPCGHHKCTAIVFNH